MVPADQCLETLNLACIAGYKRLVKQLKLSLVTDGPAKILVKLLPAPELLILGGFEEAAHVSPAVAGATERQVCCMHQCFRAAGVARIKRDANCAVEINPIAANQERLRRKPADPP